MTVIAIIGSDGAGKTTLARAIVEQYPAQLKYLYMGSNASSSNVAFPWTRLLYALKVRKERARRRARGEESAGPISLHGIEHRGDKRGPVWATARLANRFAEEILRQVVSWMYQIRGFVVVYDRHFLFDFTSMKEGPRRLTDRIHVWFLERLYPKPHMVLFLDAPSEVLYDRKREVPIEYLDERREAFLSRESSVQEFRTIDASQTPQLIYEDAAAALTDLLQRRTRRIRRGVQGAQNL